MKPYSVYFDLSEISISVSTLEYGGYDLDFAGFPAQGCLGSGILMSPTANKLGWIAIAVEYTN